MPRRPRGARRAGRVAPLAATAARACSASATASCMAARSYAAPTVVTPQVLAELRELIPLAPLHQPHNLAAIEAVCRAAAGRAAGGLLRHQLSSRPAGRRRARAAAARHLRMPACSGTAFTGSRTSTSPPCCPQVAPEIADGRVIVAHLGSGASLCAMKNGKSVDSTLGFTALDGLCMGTRPGAHRSRRHPATCSRTSASPPKKSRRSSTRSPACSASPASATTCAICSTATEPAARLAVDYFVYRAAKEIGALAAVLGGIDGLVFTAGIGENSAGDPPADLRGVRLARHRAGRRGERRQGPRISDAGSQVSAWVIPDQRRTDDRPAHRRAARA